MSKSDRERWNAKHGTAGESRPAASRLVAALERADLGRGRALDVACGRGRHALILARAGFDVLAVDVSDVGLELLTAAARDEGLVMDALRRDLATEGLPEGRFELVVVVDFLDRSLFPALRDAVAPGGAVFYQTFTVEHSEATGFRRAFCLEDGELLAAFEGFEVLAHEKGELDGRFQESLLARRPGESSRATTGAAHRSPGRRRPRSPHRAPHAGTGSGHRRPSRPAEGSARGGHGAARGAHGEDRQVVAQAGAPRGFIHGNRPRTPEARIPRDADPGARLRPGRHLAPTLRHRMRTSDRVLRSNAVLPSRARPRGSLDCERHFGPGGTPR